MVDDDEDTKECLFCLEEIPAAASRCGRCTSDLASPVSSPNIAGFWFGGFLLAIIGAFIAASDDGEAFGLIVLGVGGLLLQIAVVATAVSLGTRDRDHEAYAKRLGNASRMTT